MINKKSNIWEEFAKETNGKFIEEFSWHSAKTEIEYNGLKIIFDNYTLWSGKFSTEMTRIIVPYNSFENFKFEICRSGIIRNIEKLFGAQDVKIGREEFDKKFIIKTNNEHKIKTILQNKKIRNLIEIQKNINIQISDEKGIWEGKLPENQFELCFYDDGEIKDIERLKSLLNLIKEFIDELTELKIINKKAYC
ncbi:DUF3137 domain-containing protein [Flavobacterium sp. 5]|uniref:DUF3137 domain-containing protein n=1 Tax=Flavobacterium sp. 5 TaxID=2035199 RepID=UPI000C2B5C31|nr:DUF3137 domain-containing protein [Flavobacterium sp. 5]PKB15256.1 uncharacterized protein DUF3137 [Flavobacterium sp. 5]